jgi:hypothetical protein
MGQSQERTGGCLSKPFHFHGAREARRSHFTLFMQLEFSRHVQLEFPLPAR